MRVRALIGTVPAAVLVLLALVQPGVAGATVESFSMTPSTTQAGGHPDLSASIHLSTSTGQESPNTVVFFPPDGVVALPYAVPACSRASLAIDECDPGSQVGVATIYATYEGNSSELLGTAPVYVGEPEDGEFRELVAQIPVLGATVSGPVSIEPVELGGEPPHHLSELSFEGFPEGAPLRRLDLELWGMPAHPTHDSSRFPEGTAGCPGLADTSCIESLSSDQPETPFIESPTQCASPASPSDALIETYGEDFDLLEQPYLRTTGCDQLSFNPLVTLGALPEAAGASTDVDLKLTVPQTQSPVTPSPSEVETFSVDFQDAVEIDASPPFSHPVCGDVIPDEGPRCPEDTRIGTATFDSPLFPTPITGGIYFGEISPPVRLIWVSAAGYGVELELLFLIEPAVAGGMALELVESPQLPIESIDLHFDGKDGDLFRTGRCGKHAPVAEMVPWDEALAPHVLHLGEHQWDEGTAGPCPYVPARVEVSMAPSRLPADGISATTATATVADFYGLPLPEETVSFTASDAGQRIGPVQNAGDGTYSARIAASASPGTSTITATDTKAVPNIAGQATLVQDGAINVPPPPPTQRLTGRRAAALQKCKKKHRRKARVRCRRHALKLPR